MSKLPLGIVPRMLSREQAAEYCGCGSLSAFDEWRRRGIVPEPMPGTTKWDRKLIDHWLDRRSGLRSNDETSAAADWLAQHAVEQPLIERDDPFMAGIAAFAGETRKLGRKIRRKPGSAN